MKPIIPLIKEVVAESFLLAEGDLESNRTNRAVLYPRWIAMWLAHQFTDLDAEHIARRFGRRDEAAVNQAIERVTRMMVDDQDFRSAVFRLLVRVRLRSQRSQYLPGEAGDLAGRIFDAFIPGRIADLVAIDPAALILALLPLAELLDIDVSLSQPGLVKESAK